MIFWVQVQRGKVAWHGDLYLEDGLHRALRAALQQRQTLHARVLDLNGRHDFR